VRQADVAPSCPWLLVAAPIQPAAHISIDLRRWLEVANVRRPSDKDENVILYRRADPK